MKDRAVLMAKLLALLLLVISPRPIGASGTTSSIPVPSSWEGVIEGTVGGRAFRLPVQLELQAPLSEERNPFHLFLGAGNEGDVGNLLMSSAQQYTAPYTGRAVTLQYFTLNRFQDGSIRGVLTNDHSSAAAALNGFTGPNMAAAYAPPVMRDIYGAMGPTAIYVFRTGTGVALARSGNELIGAVSGTGGDIVNIFPAPDVLYEAQFRVRRKR